MLPFSLTLCKPSQDLGSSISNHFLCSQFYSLAGLSVAGAGLSGGLLGGYSPAFSMGSLCRVARNPTWLLRASNAAKALPSL